MPNGTIRRLMERGYGFIMREQGEDLFFHRSQIKDCLTWVELYLKEIRTNGS